MREHKSLTEKSNSPEVEECIKVRVNGSDINLSKLKPIGYKMKLFDVGDSSTSLRECVKKKINKFQRGCAYYEFTHEVESISENKELIFMTV